jgi:hypothetical protein
MLLARQTRDASAGEPIAPRIICLPLTDASGIPITGPHRFIRVSGLRGFHPTSVSTRAVLKTDLHTAARGSVSLWFAPLEDLSSTSNAAVPPTLPLISNGTPPQDVQSMAWGVYWSNGYPQLIGKFVRGGVWAQLDRGLVPVVYGEKFNLRQGRWYHLVINWDRPEGRLHLYLNGMAAGHNLRAGNFPVSRGDLWLGNPMMVLREVALQDRMLSEAEIRQQYDSNRPSGNDAVDAELRRLLAPVALPELDLKLDGSWTETYRCGFRDSRETAAWQRQGPQAHLDRFRLETTPEGLLIETPDVIDIETRMYLWSDRTFEGDQWIEYDFRLESPEGLGLLVVCASGMQREDFIADHGPPKTGGMGTILGATRNYHWEYVRRVEAMRTDVETQWLSKNPFGRILHSGCIPRLEQDRWRRLRFVKAGYRLHGSIDGRTVFDVRDDPFQSYGSAYNFGRMAFRQMYKTRMRYRDLVVYTRDGLA